MDKIDWNRLFDRIYIIAIVVASLWWASRNSDVSKVDALEQKFNGAVAEINKFGNDVQARLGAVEQRLIPGAQQQPPVAKK